MEPARQVIREFRWREIFPALILLRGFRCSLRIPAMLLSLVAAILISQGWEIIGSLTLPDDHPIRRQMAYGEMMSASLYHSSSNSFGGLTSEARVSSFFAPLHREFERFAQPVRNFFAPKKTAADRLYYFLGFAWTLLVGAFFAGAVCRMAAFDLASQERYGVFRALRFVAGRYRSFFGAPLIPLLLLTVMLLPIVLLGAFAYALPVVAAILWGLALLWGLLLGMVAVMTLFSWPLFWPALASEDSDAFDALGSSIGYASQRPFAYLAYAVIAALVSGAGLLLFSLLLLLGQHLLHFGMALGGGTAIADQFLGVAGRPREETATTILEFWDFFTKHLLDAYLFSAFWTSATGVFLLLRYDVDKAELDDIYRDGAEEEKPMPKLAREMGLGGEAASMTPPTTPAAESVATTAG